MSDKTKHIFNSCLSQAIKEGLKSVHEFWDGVKTLKVLSESDYFVEDEEAGVKWPRVFQEMISKGVSDLLSNNDQLSVMFVIIDCTNCINLTSCINCANCFDCDHQKTASDSRPRTISSSDFLLSGPWCGT